MDTDSGSLEQKCPSCGSHDLIRCFSDTTCFECGQVVDDYKRSDWVSTLTLFLVILAGLAIYGWMQGEFVWQ